jgi:hypothetical protein
METINNCNKLIKTLESTGATLERYQYVGTDAGYFLRYSDGKADKVHKATADKFIRNLASHCTITKPSTHFTTYKLKY